VLKVNLRRAGAHDPASAPKVHAEAADFSDIPPNFRIFAAQISARQDCHCCNLDAELIDL
jgi:hypothetical protein